MQPANQNTADIPVALPPTPAKTITDVAPPGNNLGNPVKFDISSIEQTPASSNPIAGTAAPVSGVIHEQPVSDASLDGVLRNVSSTMKAAQPPRPAAKPKKLFGLFSKKSQPNAGHSPLATHQPAGVPAQSASLTHAPIPTQQSKQPGPTTPKKKANPALLPVICACLAAIVLVVSAIAAF